MEHVTEIENACHQLNIGFERLDSIDAREFARGALKKFSVEKSNGHLSIGDHAVSIPLEKNEFQYSLFLKDEPAYLFFDQENHHRDEVAIVAQAQKICEVMENCYGMEYFVTNLENTYLIAVNWYAIQVVGDAEQLLSGLIEDQS